MYNLIYIYYLLLLSIHLFYWVFHFQTASVGFRRRLDRLIRAQKAGYTVSRDALTRAQNEMPRDKRLLCYLQNKPVFPVYQNTQTRYFANGRDMLGAMLEDLQHAERYILLEYFIIEQGKMWDAILEVLCERVKAGVEVRILYDDLGCFVSLPSNYAHTLRAKGIQCALFNPFHPFLTSIQNNRDHRKITVIDGKVVYQAEP